MRSPRSPLWAARPTSSETSSTTAPEGGALKITANSAGVVLYNNTFLSEIHQMGPASNLHFRNNLVLAQGAWPEVLSIETFTPWSTSDYNGFSASAAAVSSLFAWAAPADSVANYDSRAARPPQSFTDLKTYSDRTGQDRHSRMVDWSIFRKASPPAKGDATRLYRPEDFDVTLAAGSGAIDAGSILPGVTDGFTGRAPDVEALEAGRPVPAYGPAAFRSAVTSARRSQTTLERKRGLPRISYPVKKEPPAQPGALTCAAGLMLTG